jgi:pantothenate kinase
VPQRNLQSRDLTIALNLGNTTEANKRWIIGDLNSPKQIKIAIAKMVTNIEATADDLQRSIIQHR